MVFLLSNIVVDMRRTKPFKELTVNKIDFSNSFFVLLFLPASHSHNHARYFVLTSIICNTKNRKQPGIMEALISSLSNYQISQFFTKNAPLTQQQCNKEAERITTCATANPSAVQGGTSYTVLAGDYVVQFRGTASNLNFELLRYAEAAYPEFVPHHRYAGKLGELEVYLMDKVGGISMYLARENLYCNSFQLLHQTLRDYARFGNPQVSHFSGQE